MLRAILLSLIVFQFAAPSAFAKDPANPGKAAAAVHAPKDAKPGSYEDWCEEHGVPESLDTRCDKSLIPAFKATGDWCRIHGLPLSQDLKCNPNLKIVRPAKGAAKGGK
jgi:hypothetical protein